MDRVRERLEDGLKALATLEKVVDLPRPSDVERDAAIQRFEYTFEMTWKAAQAYLTDREFLEVASPRATIRGSFKAGLFSDEIAEKFMKMANDRNLTVHTYKEEFAVQLYSRLAGHAALLRLWLGEIQKRIE
jgi:nucleotidyltransferase substrate binding protein (TIGR01987 family)